jgi:hypothetical protein
VTVPIYWALQFRILEVSVSKKKISAKRPAILTEVFRGFLNPFRETWIVLYPKFFPIQWSLLTFYHSCYIIWQLLKVYSLLSCVATSRVFWFGMSYMRSVWCWAIVWAAGVRFLVRS